MLLIVLVLDGLALLLAQEATDPPPGVGVAHNKNIITPAWQLLFEAGNNLTMFYKNQSFGSEDELFRTVSFYLDEITALEEAVDDNRFRSLDAVWEIYLNGGPLHLKQIPYDKFITAYDWNLEDIYRYFIIIDRTKRIWNNLVEELQILMESTIVI